MSSSAITAIKELRATTFFLGAGAANTAGIYASFDMEKELKRALVNIAQNLVLLVDHSKFSATAPVFLIDWDSRFSVVCDREPAVADVESLRAKGVIFHTAECVMPPDTRIRRTLARE